MTPQNQQMMRPLKQGTNRRNAPHWKINYYRLKLPPVPQRHAMPPTLILMQNRAHIRNYSPHVRAVFFYEIVPDDMMRHICKNSGT